jgi:hypothetical protein
MHILSLGAFFSDQACRDSPAGQGKGSAEQASGVTICLIRLALCSVGVFGQFVQKVQERLALSDE